jgi:hypothetical protein
VALWAKSISHPGTQVDKSVCRAARREEGISGTPAFGPQRRADYIP